jgi:hypothetical protein
MSASLIVSGVSGIDLFAICALLAMVIAFMCWCYLALIYESGVVVRRPEHPGPSEMRDPAPAKNT